MRSRLERLNYFERKLYKPMHIGMRLLHPAAADHSMSISRQQVQPGARLVFWGPSASVPGGAPLGGFCDRFWGKDGYRLNFIDTDIIRINTVIHPIFYNLVQK